MRPSDRLVRWECEAGYSGGNGHSSKESIKELIRGREGVGKASVSELACEVRG